jgi:[acyl-carrier-protein] S-malonyltransferase
VLQPALVCACAIAADALAEAGVAPDVVCGHSLGELAAWAAGGHVAATDAIAAAAVRGRLMAWQAACHPGGMAVATDDLERVLVVGRAKGRLVVAGHNTPAEITVSGDAAAIAAAVAIGCRRLPVAGAWHSEAMADAVDELRAALDAIPRKTGVRFVCNRDGSVAAPERIPELLAAQLVRPIRWTACAKTLAVLGVTRFIAVGPGRLVRAMVRANLGDVDVRIFAGMRDLTRVVAP